MKSCGIPCLAPSRFAGSNGVKPSPMLIAMYLVQGLSEE